MRFQPTALFLATALSLISSNAALAHADLVKATPAAGAKASGTRTLSLSFSDAVDKAQSGVEIAMTGMPGMANHAPMAVKGYESQWSADGKTLSLTLPRALPVGSYAVKWHVVSADGHRSEGSYSFSTK